MSLLVFAVGAIIGIGGAAIGALGGAVGARLMLVVPWLHLALGGVVAGLAFAYGCAELVGAKLPVPTRHWQVPRKWAWYGMPAYAAAFGVVLGAGFLTFVTYIGYYLLLAISVIDGDPLRGGLLMAVFGVTRAVPVLLAPIVWRVGGRPTPSREL